MTILDNNFYKESKILTEPQYSRTQKEAFLTLKKIAEERNIKEDEAINYICYEAKIDKQRFIQYMTTAEKDIWGDRVGLENRMALKNYVDKLNGVEDCGDWNYYGETGEVEYISKE